MFVYLQGLPQTSKLLNKDDLSELTGTIECETPNRHLLDFVGNIRPSRRQYVLVTYRKFGGNKHMSE